MSAKQQKDHAGSINYKSQPGGSDAIESSTELGWFDWLAWLTGDKAGGASALGDNSGHSSIKNYPAVTGGPNSKS